MPNAKALKAFAEDAGEDLEAEEDAEEEADAAPSGLANLVESEFDSVLKAAKGLDEEIIGRPEKPLSAESATAVLASLEDLSDELKTEIASDGPTNLNAALALVGEVDAPLVDRVLAAAWLVRAGQLAAGLQFGDPEAEEEMPEDEEDLEE